MAGLPQWPPYLSHPHYPALRPPPPPPHRLPGAGDLEGREDKEHGAGHTPAGASGALWAQAQHSLTSFLGTMHQIAEEDRKTAAPAVAPEDATAAIEELRQQMEEMAEQASTAAAELQVECTDAAAEAKSFAEQGLSDVHEKLQRVEDEMQTLRAEASGTGQKLARLERALQSAEERWRTEAAWRAAEATVAAALTPAPAPALRGDRDEATDTWSIPVLADSSCSESLASDHGSAPLEWPEADRPEVPPAEAGLEVPPAQPIPGVFDSLFDDDKFPVLAAAESDIVVLTDPKDGYVYPALHRSGADLLCALWDGTLAESRKMAVELWADEVRAAPLPLSEELFNPPFDFEHAAAHHTPRPAPLADAAPSVSPQKAAGGADAAPAAKTPPAAAEAATSPKALNPVQAARAAAAPDAERSSAAKDFAAAAGAPPPPHPDGSSPSPDDPSVAAAKMKTKAKKEKEKEGAAGKAAAVPAVSVSAKKASLQPVDVVKSGQQSKMAADNTAKKLLQALAGKLGAILDLVPLSDFKLSKTPTQTIVSSVEKGSKAQEWGLQVNMPVLSWHASTSTCTLYVLLGDCELPGVCKTLNAVKVVEFNAKLLAKRPTDAGFHDTTTATVVNKCAVKEKDVVYAKVTTHANTATKKFYINVASSRMRKEWMRPRFTKGGLKTADGVVTAVEPKSGAWKAGLRKGMKVVSRKDEKGDGGHVNLVVEAL